MKRKYNRIKAMLAECGKTNKWLADSLKKDKSTVSRWCTNDMQPSIETLFVIAYLRSPVSRGSPISLISSLII